MPLAAMTLSVSRSAKMGLRGVATWSRGSIIRRTVAFTGVAAVAAAVAFVWWPNGDYEPIRPGEKGTVVEAVRAVPQLPSGRSSFTPEQAAAYGSVPTERERITAAGIGHDAAQPDTTTGAEPTPFDDGAGDEDPATGTDTEGFDYPAGTEDPAATSTPTPTTGGTAPAPTGEPAPSGTTEPAPSATATPSPSATATPTPSETATPAPTTSTETATPDSTALASPTAVPETGTAVPDTATPEATPTPLATP
jgi:hypothetical protein